MKVNQNTVLYFIFSLLNETVCNPEYIASNVWVIVNNKLGKIRKRDVVN
jgi:hypothetical protein